MSSHYSGTLDLTFAWGVFPLDTWFGIEGCPFWPLLLYVDPVSLVRVMVGSKACAS